MPILTITVDANANQKLLRRLELEGHVELHAIKIENMIGNKKIKRKDLPIAVIDSPHATIGNSVIAANDTRYNEISTAMTKDNHGDALHLDGHIRSKRDVFVTDDNDFLLRRGALEEKFCISIKTSEEVFAMFPQK